MVKKIYFSLSILFLINSIVCSQDIPIDTAYYSPIQTVEKLDYTLGKFDAAFYEVIDYNLEIKENDTVKNTLVVDSFKIKILSETESFLRFEYSMSYKTFSYIMFKSECIPDTLERIRIPTITCKYHKKKNELEIENFLLNSPILKRCFEHNVQCIQQQEDQFLLNYSIQWQSEVDSVGFQEKLLLQDLKKVFLYRNNDIPKIDSLKYALIPLREDLKNYSEHILVTKEVLPNGNSVFRMEDDLSKGISSEKMVLRIVSDLMDERITKQEKENFEKKIDAYHSERFFKITLDPKNNFLIYQQYYENRKLKDGILDQTVSEYSIQKKE